MDSCSVAVRSRFCSLRLNVVGWSVVFVCSFFLSMLCSLRFEESVVSFLGFCALSLNVVRESIASSLGVCSLQLKIVRGSLASFGGVSYPSSCPFAPGASPFVGAAAGLSDGFDGASYSSNISGKFDAHLRRLKPPEFDNAYVGQHWLMSGTKTGTMGFIFPCPAYAAVSQEVSSWCRLSKSED